MNYSKIKFLFFSFLFICFHSFSQTEGDVAPFNLRGKIFSDGKSLKDVNIILSKDGKQLSNYTTDKSGTFAFSIFQNIKVKESVYKVVFYKPGYVTKTLYINTYRNQEDYDGIPFDFVLDRVDMYPTKYSDINFSRASGKIKWLLDPLSGKKTYDFDPEYEKSFAEEKRLLKNDPDEYMLTYNKKGGNDDPNKELNEKYNAEIAKGNAAMTSKNYDVAKNAYTEASKLKPTEELPKTKLAEIKSIEAAIAKAEADRIAKEKDDKYNAAISKGNNAITSKSYQDALTAFNEASSLKPNEQLPKTKIAEINALISSENAAVANAKKEQDYNDAISNGNSLIVAKKYIDAKKSFQKAAELKPTEELPKTKLAQIDKLIEAENIALQENKITDKYNNAIAKGNASLKAKNYDEAKLAFTEASKLKPNEQLPKTKLAEIESLIKAENIATANAEKEKELTAKYESEISKGNIAITEKNYTDAKLAFTEASKLKPNEQLPKTKLAEIESLIKAENIATANAEKEKILNEKYQDAIIKGNSAFESKNYVIAKQEYSKALQLKPNEELPKSKIAEIEDIQNALAKEEADRIAKEKKAKAEADRIAKEKADAIAKAETDRLAKEKAEAARIAKRKSDSLAQAKIENDNAKYQAFINLGDEAFDKKNYVGAKASYKEALAIKRNEQYPKNRISEINKILNVNSIAANPPVNKTTTTEPVVNEKPEVSSAEFVKIPAFDGTKIFSESKEKLKIYEEKKKFEKNKAENLSVKYETKNPSTSLMDAVDAYDKKNKYNNK